ncbi:MAG: SGNH/GDSL hydrolase family protein [Pirellulaceae bacterium]
MKRMTTVTAVLAVLLVGLISVIGTAQQTEKKTKAKAAKKRKVPAAYQPVTDVPGLPRALLIGDSISIGYTVAVREELKGKVNLHRPATNCGPTTRGVEQIDAWLGDGKWDVIHFNWGLHDLKHMDPRGRNLADPKAADSKPQVPIDSYEANLRKLVGRMKQTGAKLIWCTTTPVPSGAQGRVVGDAVKYNDVAAKVMQECNIATDDLYSFAKPRLQEIQRPANVHFSPEGSKALAKQVAESILAQLQKD